MSISAGDELDTVPYASNENGPFIQTQDLQMILDECVLMIVRSVQSPCHASSLMVPYVAEAHKGFKAAQVAQTQSKAEVEEATKLVDALKAINNELRIALATAKANVEAYKARAKTVEEKFARLNSSKANLEE